MLAVDKEFVVLFRLSQQMIRESMDQIRQNARNYTNVKPRLGPLQDQLLVHLGRQNNLFYGQIASFVSHVEISLKMIEFLTHDLKDIKIKTLLFFDAHPGDLSDQHPKNFLNEYPEFMSAVLARIKMEEEYLLPMLEKMASGDAE